MSTKENESNLGIGNSESEVIDSEHLRTVYRELCNSYRAIDDFRAKLLGFLPLATGTGIFLLLGNLKDFQFQNYPVEAKSFFAAVGIFGFLITLGLFFYEIYGVKKCAALINAGKQLEDFLHITAQFQSRPQNVVRLINEPFAAGVIYPTVLAAWMYLALDIAWSQLAGIVAASGIIMVGVAGIIIYWTLASPLEKPRKTGLRASVMKQSLSQSKPRIGIARRARQS